MIAALAIALLVLVAALALRPGRRRHSLRYRLYLSSPLWRLRRRLWIASTLGRCERCHRRRRPLTIHHRTYHRLGRERRADVEVLCWSCHTRQHAHQRPRPRRVARARSHR